MDRARFSLECCADRADRLLHGIDKFPDCVFQELSSLLSIHTSNTSGGTFVIYPQHDVNTERFSIRVPPGAKDVLSPSGLGIFFRVNGENYHVFCNVDEGKKYGSTTYTEIPLTEERRSP